MRPNNSLLRPRDRGFFLPRIPMIKVFNMIYSPHFWSIIRVRKKVLDPQQKICYNNLLRSSNKNNKNKIDKTQDQIALIYLVIVRLGRG